MKTRDPLNEAYGRLEALVPSRFRGALHWLHGPRARPVRIPLGIFCILASFFWFLPVVGLEFFPFGLLLLAHDIPALRRPAGNLTLWLLDKFEHLRATMLRGHGTDFRAPPGSAHRIR